VKLAGRTLGAYVLAVALVGSAPVAGTSPPSASVTVSIVGTSDLHGRLGVLPRFGGYLANLRRARARDGGAVLLLDAGDMFQGTLESNANEGAAVVRAYEALHYDAVAIGNHEFDYGPVGDASAPEKPSDDPRGALKARAAEAHFPFLAANIVAAATHAPPAWANVRPSAVVEKAGIRVGIVGATTVGTPRTTLAANFAGLAVTAIAPAVTSAARALRGAGAEVVVLTAHAGGACKRVDDPADLSSCESDSEIFTAARAMGAGTVDAVVAGHTHDGVAQRVAGTPIVESYAEGRAFGRIDLSVDRASHRVLDVHVFPPHRICAGESCDGESYEGAPVAEDPAVAAAIAPALEAARTRRDEKLGVAVTKPVVRARTEESALGNLFADLMRAARPDADVSLTNGGGLRADLAAGPLTYGRLYDAAPFDNRFATIVVTGAELERLVAANLGRSNGIVSLSGVVAVARCESGRLVVALRRPDGRPVTPAEKLTLVTSDFLATGGDGLFPEALQRAARLDGGPPIREWMAARLRARKGTLAGDAPALFDPTHPRLTYPAPRPVRCGGASQDL
jgi:5'-nucleotidase